LSEDGVCWLGWLDEDAEEYTQSQGDWLLGSGGVVLLRSDGYAGPEFWYGGAVRGYWLETEEEFLEDYEMMLYSDGGVIRLDFTGYG